MKKFILITLLICIISGCSNTTSTNTIKKDTSLDKIINLTYDQLNKKLKCDDIFVLYIGRPDCRDCQEFEPILNEYLDDNKGVYLYYLNTKEFRDAAKSSNASKKEIDFYDNLYEELDFKWTPTLKLINSGKFISNYQYLDEDYYQINDKTESKEAKETFINDFKEWMNEIFV